jgi:peptidoglycan/LPS O-acetylase OafA/YrhL
MQAKSNYIPALDGLRAVAIFLLILAHAVDVNTYRNIAGLGRIGMHTYLALSGFLITTRLLQEHAHSGSISLRNFYIRSVFRALPPAIFYVGVIWLLARTGFVMCSWTAIRAAFLLYTDYQQFTEFGWRVGHFFSIAVESHFYLLWPAMLLLFGVRKGWKTAAIAAAIIIVWRTLDDHYRIAAHLFHAPTLQQNLYRTDLVADVLFWGCCLAFYLRSTARISLSALHSTVIVAIASVILAVPIFWDVPHIAFVILLAPTVLIGAIALAPDSPIATFVKHPVLRFFGKLAFSLYIWQQLFLGGPGPRLPMPYALTAILVCAYASYKVIEEPSMRLGHRLSRNPVADSQRDLPLQQISPTSEYR